jgi:molybdate transport system substrate-binding protein
MPWLCKKIFKLMILLAFTGFLPVSSAQDLRLAVASNFANTAKELVRDFSDQTGHRVSISTASTGKFYAQISQGAPFDVLLAADRLTPERLVKDDLAIESSLYDYARGRLMFVSMRSDSSASAEQVLRQAEFKKLAIANPELAPYGKAALQTLTHLGMAQRVGRQLVMAENIGQAAQFVLSGNADAGFLPQALVVEANLTQKKLSGAWLVPEQWHTPIIQSAVLLKRGSHNPVAQAFLTYLKSHEARRLISSHGYD